MLNCVEREKSFIASGPDYFVSISLQSFNTYGLSCSYQHDFD